MKLQRAKNMKRNTMNDQKRFGDSAQQRADA